MSFFWQFLQNGTTAAFSEILETRQSKKNYKKRNWNQIWQHFASEKTRTFSLTCNATFDWSREIELTNERIS